MPSTELQGVDANHPEANPRSELRVVNPRMQTLRSLPEWKPQKVRRSRARRVGLVDLAGDFRVADPKGRVRLDHHEIVHRRLNPERAVKLRIARSDDRVANQDVESSK